MGKQSKEELLRHRDGLQRRVDELINKFKRTHDKIDTVKLEIQKVNEQIAQLESLKNETSESA